MSKQNQSIYRPFQGEQIGFNHNDHLSNIKCLCQICQSKRQRPNPQISIDEKYQILKAQKYKQLSNTSMSFTSGQEQTKIEQFQWYLKKLAFECKTLPNFPILDTMIMQKGQLSFYLHSQNNKCKLYLNSLFSQPKSPYKFAQTSSYSLNVLKQKFIERKALNDIQYQKTKYKEINPNFEYAQLDHDSQKLIKQFQKKIKFIDQMLNRVAIIKQKDKTNDSPNLSKSQQYRTRDSRTPTSFQQQSQKVLSKYEFLNLFDKTRVKACQLQELSSIQLFPIMYGEEEQSYVRQIKYFRKSESEKQLFKQAQAFVLSWLQKNDTLQRMEQQFVSDYFYSEVNLKKVEQFPRTAMKRLLSHIEQQYLMYQSYKLLLHFEAETNIQVSQCLLQYITANNGATFYLKSIKYIKSIQKLHIQTKQNKLPTHKNIDKEYYIDDIQKQMRQMFENVSFQYQRFNQDWEGFENKTKSDRMQSDQVFKTVRGFKEQGFQNNSKVEKEDLEDYDDFQPPKYSTTEFIKLEQTNEKKEDQINLHKILKSTDQKYKEEMLGLNKKFKTNSHQHANVKTQIKSFKK